MRTTIVLLLMVVCSLSATAQPTRMLSDEVRTLQVTANNDQTQAPVIWLGTGHIDLDFDILSHEYRRLTYRVEHCTAEWEPSDLFESDFLEGFGDLTIDDCEKSFNTSVLYTHYHLRLPNREARMRLSGNYRVKIVDEDEESVLAEACFVVAETTVPVRATMTTRTDKDTNGRHQQIEMEIGYGALGIVDPHLEFKTLVMQNRRWDNRVEGVQPNIQGATSIAFTHRRELIFDAGAECHKFEIINKNEAPMGVDYIEFHNPFQHAVLYPHRRPVVYNYDEDHNGAFVIRDRYGENPHTQAEYMFVHFAFECEHLPRSVYVQGDMTHGQLLPEYEMQYDESEGMYELGVLLKQGYYEYRFVTDDGRTALTEGDFHETHNEYAILVYYRPRGGRYDRLVGVCQIK